MGQKFVVAPMCSIMPPGGLMVPIPAGTVIEAGQKVGYTAPDGRLLVSPPISNIEDHVKSGYLRPREYAPPAPDSLPGVEPKKFTAAAGKKGDEAVDADTHMRAENDGHHAEDAVLHDDENARREDEARMAKAGPPVEPGRNVVGQQRSPWTFDPSELEDKSLDDLNLLAAEHGHKGEFQNHQQAVEFMSKDRA